MRRRRKRPIYLTRPAPSPGYLQAQKEGQERRCKGMELFDSLPRPVRDLANRYSMEVVLEMARHVGWGNMPALEKLCKQRWEVEYREIYRIMFKR